VDDQSLKHVIRQQRGLKEKALIDFVNGIHVIEDHIRTLKEPSTLLSRVWSIVTGDTEQRNLLITVNLAQGMKTISDWLEDLQKFQAESDLAISLVANMLTDLKLIVEKRFGDLDIEIQHSFEHFQEQYEKLQGDIRRIDLRSLADWQLRHVSQHISDNRIGESEKFTKILLHLDELRWGDFGKYLREEPDDPASNLILEQAYDLLGNAIGNMLGINSRKLVPSIDYIHQLNNEKEDIKDILGYLYTFNSQSEMPLHSMISLALRDSSQDLLPSLPYVMTPRSIVHQFFLESQRIIY
jgi:hypothetical protein